ncbi:MAG: adenylate cyclase, partial [Thermoleophilia bacterium]|nr:adenylate cyclase [Thermoleophilia bacterium]
MADAPRTHLQRALMLAGNLFTWGGLLLAVPLLLLTEVPSARVLAYAVLLLVIGVVSGHLEIEFRFASTPTSVVPDGVAWIVAAIVLPAPMAMVVAILSSVPALRNGVRRELANGGALASTLGIVSWGVHSVAGTPDVRILMVVGFAAGVAFYAIQLLEGVAYLESVERGSGREFLVNCWKVDTFHVVLPTIAVGIVAPFVANPLLTCAMLAGYQALVYLGLTVLRSEQVHRSRSRYLSDTFSRYVPAAMVEQLSEEEAAVTLGGAEVEITVMFVDVRGFTSWSEHLQPTEIVTQLNELLGACTEAIFTTGGTLDKFTGDGLMAFWGAPVRQADHAARACHAALDMLDRIAQLNEERAPGTPRLYIGVGVHTGTALVGNIGHSERLDYTAIGDTVNVAARLEAATKEAGCDALASASTLALLAD